MNRITRREILRRLAGISVLGAAGTAIRATLASGSPREVRPLASHSITGSTHAPSSSVVTSALSGASTSADHANHSTNPSAAPSTTTESTTQPTTASTETISPASSSTTSGTAAVVAPTTSAPPVAAAGTSELSGVLGPTVVPAGTTAKIVGDIELRGDLVVEGLLTGIDRFTLKGNGFQIEVRNGGQLDLRGIAKSGWVRGVAPTGWEGGDRILTAPTQAGRYALSDFHSGSPGVVNLADGRTIVAEQFNLTRSITIDSVSRIMFHMGAGRQVLKHIAVTNSGLTGKLAFYPIHFHFNGDSTRGSTVEGVVVENGRFHAFVPHASHGITFLDCVAFNTTGDAYWWDPPPGKGDTSNDSHETVWHHCLAASVSQLPGSTDHRLTAFSIGAGSGNRCVDCTAVGVRGGKNSSGFLWSENSVWDFRGCVAHNNPATGIFTWTNSANSHVIEAFTAYHFGRAGIEHGAYKNQFSYRNVSLTASAPVDSGSDATQAVRQHANSDGHGLLFENVISDDRLVIDSHGLPGTTWTIHRASRYRGVVYAELGGNGTSHPSRIRFEDCHVVPADFTLDGILPDSVIEIVEGGVVAHGWAGSWT